MISDFLVFFAVYFALGELIIVLFAIKYSFKHYEVRLFTFALLFRLLLTFFYYYRTFFGGSDATSYYPSARYIGFHSNFWSFFKTGTIFIDNLAWLFYPLISFFDNTYLMLYIPFSLIAFAGSILFYRTLVFMKIPNWRMIFFVSFFLPNLVFWSSNLGKDSIIYFGITGLIYSLRKFPKVNFPATLAFGTLIYFVRPHIIGLMLISIMLGIFLQRNKLNFRNIVFFIMLIGSFLFLQEKIFKFVGIKVDRGEDTEQTQANNYSVQPGLGDYYDESMKTIETMSTQYKGTGAEIKQPGKLYTLLAPYYMISFISMPFIWQARTPIQFASAVESLIYQYFLLIVILNWRLLIQSTLLPQKYSWIIYTVLTSIIFGMSTSNFGLGVRQKCMVLPLLIIFYVIVKTKKDETNKLKKEKRALFPLLKPV